MNSNPTPDPRVELEARLTALLLGELSATEAAELNAAIARDPQLAQLHARLQQTIQLVREASAAAPQAVAGQTDSPRLSEERRAKLLAHFTTAPMPQTTMAKATPSPRRRELKWMVPLSLAAALVGLISFAALRLNDSRVAQNGESPISKRYFDQWKETEKEDTRGLGSVRESVHQQSDHASLALPFAQVEIVEPSPGSKSKANMPGIVLPAGQDSSGAWGKPTDTAATTSLGRNHAYANHYSTGSGVTLNEGTLAIESLRAVGGKLTQDSDTDGLKNNKSLTFFSHGGVTTKNTAGLPSPAAPGAAVTFGSTAFSYDPEPAPTPTPSSSVAGNGAILAHPSPSTDRSVDLFFNNTITGSGGIAAASDLQSQLDRGKSTVFGTAGLPILGDIPVTDKPTVENEIYNEQPVPTESPLVVNSPAPIAGSDFYLRKAGAGRLFVTGATTTANTFSGGTVINAGTLRGGDLINDDSPVSKNGIIAGNATFADKHAANQEQIKLKVESPTSNGRDDASKFSVNKNGAATWALSGANTYAGDTKVSGGTLLVRGTGPESPSTAKTLQPSPSPEPFGLYVTEPSLSPSGKSSSRDNLNVDGTALTAGDTLGLSGNNNSFAGYDTSGVLDKEKLQLGKDTITLNGGTLVLGAKEPAVAQRVQNSSDAKPEAKGLSPRSRESDYLLRKDPKRKSAESAASEELAKLEQVRDTLNLKVMQETIDSSLGRSSIAVITDPAEANPSETPTLWQRLTGSVERTARITIDRDASDVTGTAGQQTALGYDPHFVQTEAEKIQSKAVLFDTIDRLKLNEKWAKKNGTPLKTAETYDLLRKKVTVGPSRNNNLMEIRAKSDSPEEAALIANTIAESYRDARLRQRTEASQKGIALLTEKFKEADAKIAEAKKQLAGLQTKDPTSTQDDVAPRKPAANAPVPQPEILARENNFSTFSLNVSDVSFKLAAASLEKGQMPDPATVRSEEFINAFDYRDPEPLPGVPIGFAWERAHYPFAHNRDLLRFSVKTAALGRQAGRPLNVVLLLDNSGSMERADRVSIVREALRVLASQLQAQDKLSVITFARTPRLWVDGVSGDQAGKIAEQVGALTPEGGTNLEEAMNLGYQTALRHYLANGINHVVLLTDGAANLGNVEPESLKQKVEAHRRQGIALDCFGVGWEGFNDDLLEVLARNGDGRYGFINTPEEAATQFAGQLAGALHVAASDVKVQVEFNPRRVTSYRQIGYAKHQLTKEQFRDNTVDAAELAAQEAGNALYTIETNPRGEGPVCTVRVRFKVPGTGDFREHSWDVPFTGNAVSLEQASHAMRLAAAASAFSEWLVASPFAGEVTLDRLLTILSGIPEIYGADARPKKLEEMIRQAKSVSGR